MDPSFYNAAVKGDIEAFKNIQQPLNSLLTPSENTVLHIYITSLDQESESTTKFVEELLNIRPSLLWKTNANNETPLHLGARYGHISIAKFLIEQANTLSQDLESGAEARMKMLRMMDKEKNTALHEAVRFGHLEVVKLLIHEDPEMIAKLLERFGGLTKQADQNGWTPLHLAATSWRDTIVKLLLESDRHVAYMKDAKGRTPLHLAAYNGTLGIINGKEKMKVVLTNPSASKLLNEKDIDGKTPLHYQSNTEDIKENLLDHNRVDKMALNREKLTAYDIALSSTRPFDAWVSN
ncbi:hypothetical protein CJ030_MR1G006145 [Morella rubra]|uniref:Uncharacterized protein n=1 Tax=Morella rubra TaxID=262757 RepID=A0A6A1WV29_9ROSI|nr:hypothetical protein CJ030_MR1G006145 [Morella rubra]